MDGLIAYALAKKYADAVGQQVLSAGFKVQVEQDRSILNSTGQEKIMYFLPKTVGSTNDGYDEFIYAQNAWEWVGKTDVDLSGYALKTEVGNLENLSTTEKASLVAAINELFQSVSNGKTLVASAITDKGVSTSSDATFSIMAQNIEDIPTGGTVLNPALVLWDWEGTKLAAYSREDSLALTELPAPSTLPPYAHTDHDLLVFQKWNLSLANIKAWIQAHEGKTLDVGAIYTTTDGQDHNYWGNPRLDTAATINMQKRATTSIGTNAFQNCNSLTSINIPDGVTSIGDNAYQYCRSLTHISIPDSVTSIGSYAFSSCYSLTSINIPDGVTSIGGYAFGSCYSLTSINIPDGVTSIGGYAFGSCVSLTSINIPDGVTSIGDSAFNGCYSLTQINIPDSVTSIMGNAFYNCCSLTHISIPDSVTSIGSYAFYNCYSLCDVLLESKPKLTNTNALSGLPTNYRIYVPRANLSWFETATNWSKIYTRGHIVAIEDYINYLESLGFDVDKYKEVTKF